MISAILWVAAQAAGAASQAISIPIGAADFLSMEASTRLSGTAGAFAAEELGPMGVFTSPASTLGAGPPELSVSFIKGLLDTTYGFVSGTTHSESGNTMTAAFSYDRTDRVRVVRPGEVPVDSAPVYDLAFVAAFAKRSNAAIAFGVDLKAFDSRLVDTESRGAAVDVDVLMTPETIHPARLQLSARNVGYASAHVSLDSLTGASAAAALSAPIDILDGQRLTLGCLLLRPVDPTLPFDFAAGVEYALRTGVAFRAGYRTGALLNHVTLGFGIHASALTLDYAFVPFAELGASHRLSLSYLLR